MDLNVSPSPDDDEQQYEDFEEYVQQPSESVQTLHRERAERRNRLKRENQDAGSKHLSQQSRNNNMQSNRNTKAYGRDRQLPQGWLGCHPQGQPIAYMIPSKVPLDESYNDLVLPGKRYSSKQVISSQKRTGREIGLVIDLTNTTRYYSPNDWIKLGIKHVKIRCKGRDAVPDNESVNIFVYEVMQFLSRQRQSKKYILVHCTHGHNRTGYMIVHYLMRTEPTNVAEAVHLFSQNRPPGIYKKDYIEALYSFYHEVPENLICPSTPEWKKSPDLDLNGEAMPEEDDDGNTEPPVHEHAEEKIMTNDDVLGDTVPYDQQNAMRHICYQLFGLAPTGRGNAPFPGSHPVSLNRENLQLLRQRYYYATWKADGTRYMMLVATDGCYLIDRNFCFRRIQMRFPLKNMNEGFHNFTLLDGEMVIDKLPDGGLKRRYLIYDLVSLNSRSVVKLPFSERWKLLEEEVIRPRHQERKQFETEGKCNPIYRYDLEPFSVRQKEFYLLSAVNKLLKGFIPTLCHESDGLIFQGWDDPYVPRTHEGLLKWKYPEMNSVDFLFEVGSENRQLLFLYERGKKKLMDGAQVIFGGEEDISSLSGKIVECSWDEDAASWICMRIRADKNTPNDINTYRKVMRSIKDNITEEVILNEIAEIVRLPMYADRIAAAEAQKLKLRRTR